MRIEIRQAFLPEYLRYWTQLTDLHRQFTRQLEQQSRIGSPEKLALAVREVSDIYNRLLHRPASGRRDLACARLQFFLPTDLPKVWLPLAELLPHMELDKRQELSVLDLGAGAGTVTAGLVFLLQQMGFAGTVNVTQVEPDSVVGNLASQTMSALRQVTSVKVRERMLHEDVDRFLKRPVEGRFDLVIMLDVLTEMYDGACYAAEVTRLAQQLLSQQVKRTGYLVFIEPALKQVSRLLSEAGGKLGAVAPVVAPCPTGGQCPALEKPGGFCFHSISCPLSPLVQSVSARSQLARHEVNFSYLTLSPRAAVLPWPEVEQGLELGRVVSFPRRGKKGFHYHVCTKQGLQVAWVPRLLADGEIRGGRLKLGTLVALAIP